MRKSILYILLYLFFIFTPSESISIIQGGGLSLPKLSFVFLFLSFIITPSIRGLQTNSFIKMLLLYSAWALITSVFSINIEAAMLRWLSFLVPLVILIYMLNILIYDETILCNIMKSYVFGCLIPIYVMMKMIIIGGGGDIERMTVLGQDQNELSVLLCIGVSFVFYLFKNGRLKLFSKVILLIFSILSSTSILLTGSRTGFIILLSVLILGFLSLGKKGVVSAICISVLVLPLVLEYIPTSNIDRLLQTQEQISEGDFTGRGYIWARGIEALTSLPSARMLIGVGYDQFPYLLKETFGIWKAPHNTYLATFIEQGSLGFCIFSSLLILVLINTIRLCRLNKNVVYFTLILPILISMMTLGLQTRRWLWVVLFMLCKMYEFDRRKFRM